MRNYTPVCIAAQEVSLLSDRYVLDLKQKRRIKPETCGGNIKSYLYEQKELGERAIIPIAARRSDRVVRHRSNGEERGSNSSVFISKE